MGPPRDVAEANAAFIVRAVNSHEALVWALEQIEFTVRTGVMSGTENSSDPLHMTKNEVIKYCGDTAIAALAQAKEGE